MRTLLISKLKLEEHIFDDYICGIVEHNKVTQRYE